MDIESTEAWIAFCDMRKAKGKRAPFTDLARKRILFELQKFQAAGQDVDAILWKSVTNGWSGVFAQDAVSGSETSFQRGRRERVAEMTGGLVSARAPGRQSSLEIFDAASSQTLLG